VQAFASGEKRLKKTAAFITSVVVFAHVSIVALAQIPVPPPPTTMPLRSSAELDQMLGPIALYPDPLIAQILPAATLPSQVVMTHRSLQQGMTLSQIDLQPWDPSVKALARYPDLLRWMDENIGWTTETGQAFLYQPTDVMNSIQHLRGQAWSLGNLQSTPQQTVITENGIIEIVPANPQVIYVPVFQPQVVFTQRPPRPGFFVSFGQGVAIGPWLNHDVDWREHQVVVWGHDRPRPPDWWSRPPSRRPPQTTINQNATVWRPSPRAGLSGFTRGDRGWGTRDVRPSIPAPRPAPPAIVSERRGPPVRRSGGALSGIESTSDTQQYRNRGEQSRRNIGGPPSSARGSASTRATPPAQRATPSDASRGPANSPERGRR